MKASEIIRLALANHYAHSLIDVDGWRRLSVYMCHATTDAIKASNPELDYDEIVNLAAEVHDTFMPIIRIEATYCLTVFLSRTNKKYAAYRRRWGDNCKACFKIRVQWWNDHIAMLESKGL